MTYFCHHHQYDSWSLFKESHSCLFVIDNVGILQPDEKNLVISFIYLFKWWLHEYDPYDMEKKIHIVAFSVWNSLPHEVCRSMADQEQEELSGVQA